MSADTDKVFAGSIPRLYETYLVPLIFEPYADDLVRRLAARPLGRVLEVACGTGVVTRRLASALPPDVSIVATDLNRPMLEHAAALGTARSVEWRTADAQQLPFEDGSFDAVVCQFGAMFFPDKAGAYAEARRVLRAGGVLLFNVWDRIEENEFADVVTEEVGALFPADPPRFLARTPHGYHALDRIAQELRAGGFEAPPQADTVTATSRAASPELVAVAYCQGTPLRNEIEARDAARLEEATARAAAALARRFGAGPIEGRIQAHVLTIER
jgi:ubiquinone/menaquinone biosynthesis C-methylase UbiE